MTLSRKELDVRRELDESFKPLFEQHEHTGGLPMRLLYEELKQSNLPRGRVQQFLKSADLNQDGRISYQEFVHEMTLVDEVTYRQLSRTRRALNKAVMAVAPQIRRRPVRVPADSADMYYNWGEDKDLESYVQAYDCKPPPLFIPLITLVEIAMFIYYAVEQNRNDDPDDDVGAASGWPRKSPLVYSPYRRVEAWRFVSYALTHNGYIHLIFNCLLQLILGALLELVHKFWRVGIVYILGVFAGSLAHSVFDPYVYLVGASGGCYALIGAHFATIIMNWEEMQHEWLKNPITFFSSACFRLIILTFLAGGDTGLAIYNRYGPDATTAAKVGFAAHGGGFLAGILIGVPVLRNLEIKRWEIVCFWICLVVYILFTLSAIVFNIVCHTFKPVLCYATDLTKY
jgi:rhomboid-related protein 1/2/3